MPRRASWADSVAHQRTESALALGIVLAIRSHLSQLASCVDARHGARLRADSRADAFAAARSLAPFLAPCRARVSRLRARAPMAARKSASPPVTTSRGQDFSPAIHSFNPPD